MVPRIVFMGSPDFALPTLKALAEHYYVAGVITQPDRPAGRGRLLSPPPIKVLAQELHLPIIQPRRLRDEDAMVQLRAWDPELIVVAAFGQILRPEVLDLPPLGSLNVHASLLPRWRGAAPVQAAILQGDQETGVTIMKMDPGIDTGPILSQRVVPINSDDTAGSLSEKLAEVGAELLIDTLPEYLGGKIQPVPQEGEATYAHMLKKEDGKLNFTRPAAYLSRQVRAFDPWPGAFTTWQDQTLKLHKVHDVPSETSDSAGMEPGTRTVFEGLPAYATGDGLLILDKVQPAGKKLMEGFAFLMGARDWR